MKPLFSSEKYQNTCGNTSKRKRHDFITLDNKKHMIVRNIFRVLLGSFLVFAGVGHLTFSRQEFQAQVPTWVPMNADLVVLLSGVAEIAMGLALIFVKEKFSVHVGWIIALFFVAVFPGNLAQYTHHRDAFGLNTDAARLTRLFFQPVLIFWVLWSTNAILRSTRSRSVSLPRY
jgi:uncharacterized membrane protein